MYGFQFQQHFTPFAQKFCPKQLQSQNVTREKLQAWVRKNLEQNVDEIDFMFLSNSEPPKIRKPTI